MSKIHPIALAAGLKAGQIGRKAYNLAALQNAGFRIPFSLVLPASVLDDTLSYLGLLEINKRLQTSVHRLPEDKTNALSQELTAGLNSGITYISREIARPIADIFRSNSVETMALRSSGVLEDLGRHSFAGQYYSALHIIPQAENIARALIEVWTSLWGSVRLAYVRQEKIDIRGDGLAVLLQEMVPARLAGVLFSQDPAQSSERQIRIEYVEGTAEKLVEGEQVPRVLLIAQGANGAEQPEPFSELARAAQVIEKKYGFPVDVEWAWDGDNLYFLQLRPVTAGAEVNPVTVWTRENVGEVIPDVVTPLTWSLMSDQVNSSFVYVLKSLGLTSGDLNLVSLHEGYVFFNHTLFNETLSKIYLRKNLQTALRSRSVLRVVQVLLRSFKIVFHLLWTIFTLKRKIRFFSRTKEKFAGRNRIELIGAVLNSEKHNMNLHVAGTFFAEIYYQLLDQFARQEMQTTAAGLLSGTLSAESARPAYHLLKLASEIKNNPAFVRALRDLPAENLRRSDLAVLKLADADLAGKLDQFFEQFGHNALHEFELYQPRWAENPAYVISNLLLLIAAPETQGKAAPLSQQPGAERNLPLLKRLVFRYLYRQTVFFSLHRENLKQHFVRRHYRLKTELTALAKELQSAGVIGETNDIFFLHFSELSTMVTKSPASDGYIPAARQRRLVYEAQCAKPAALKILEYQGSRQPVFREEFTGELRGIACSPGIVTGLVRVITDAEKAADLQPGEILVAPSTNPGWTPLFARVAGVITEVGGALSHGAIIAREYRLPMITAIPQITKILKTGNRIRLDGYRGVIEILE